jgi:hypothetical protein
VAGVSGALLLFPPTRPAGTRRTARAWPPFLERLTPNVAANPGSPWVLEEVHGTVIHATRSGRDDFSLEDEWELTLRYFSQEGSNFAHFLVGPNPGQWAQVQHDHLRAWHGGSNRADCPDELHGLNRNWRAIEVAEPVKGRGFTEWQYRATAYLVVRWHRRDGLPLAHLRSLDGATSARGVVGHEDTSQGRCYGKSDPGALDHGGSWDWAGFMSEVHAIEVEP